MRIVRRIGKWLGVTLLGVLALLVVVFALIQTPPGKAMLASIGSSLASSDGMRIEISDIGGFIPSDMSVGRVRVSDADGPFAEVDGIRLSWSPLALLSGTLDITDAGASMVALMRKPELPASPEAPESEGGSGGFMLPVRIGHFALDKVVIAEPVLGHEAELSLTASAELLALERGLSADFDLQRHDAPGSVTGKLHYAPQTGRLDVDVTAQEPAGGLVARAAGMDGLPALLATLKGSGPLDAFDAHLDVSAGDVARISGAAGVRAIEGGHRINFALDADIAKLLPADIAPLFEGRTELAGKATVDAASKIGIESFTARAAGFGAGAKGTFDAGTMTADLAVGVNVGDAARFAALAPGVSWRSVALEGTVKGAVAAPAVVAKITAEGLKGAGYGAGSLIVNATTVPDARNNLALRLDGQAQGLSADDPKVAGALGQTASFTVRGARLAGGSVSLTDLTAQLSALTARFAGNANPQTIAGTLHLEKLDLAALSPLAGRPLSGTAAFDVKVDASGDFSRAELDIKGGTQGIKTGIAAVDGLFGKTATLAGALARDGESAIRIDGLNLAADGLAVTANGTISKTTANLKATLALADLARIDPKVSGALNGEAAFSGSLDALGLKARLTVPSGKAMGQPIEGLALDLTASDITGKPSASFKLGGKVAGKPATGSGAFATLADGARQLKGLAVAIGSVTAKGDVTLDANSLATGTLVVAAGNLADLSALALTEMAGKLNADIALDVANGKQRVAVKADADKVRVAGQTVDSAHIDATVVDPAGIPKLDGTVRLSGVNAGGVAIPQATLDATASGTGTALKLDASVNGANVAAAGLLSQRDKDMLFRLDRLNLTRGAASLATSAPANFTVSGGNVTIDKLSLATRGGGATVSGRAGQTLDLAIDLRALPLSLADLAAPGLGLAGTLSGAAKISGPAKTPAGNYTLSVAGLSNPDIARNGVGPLDIKAEGQLAGGRVTTRASITGRYITGLTVSGSAPLGAGDLDLAIKGALDLAVANPMLATSGARVAGRAAIDATVKGTAAAPRAGGTIRLSDGRFDDSVNGVSLSNIEGVITGTERSVTLSSLSAKTPNGGGLTARGNVALDPAAGFPGKINVDLTNAGLVNSELMRFVGEGNLAVEGAFANNPRLTGRLVVKNLDVNIPDRLPGGGDVLDVRHVNVAGRRDGTSGAKAQAARPAPKPNAGMPLDLVVSAPNNVFVRGMGLEAELGGDLKVTGTSGAPVTQGGFEMRRGTFDVLGKRLTFTRGKITFTGTTDPELDFVAETTANDITAQILVNGPASKPDITFSSTPTLPQDEVLSRLMFGRSAGTLTAGQALQVAQTIAQFSGGGPGVTDRLRRSLGVDSLDVGTNAAGTGGQVGIGKRINDKMYLGVKQGTTPNSSQVTVDIDITKNIRLQGATSADGAAEVGIGAQWDY